MITESFYLGKYENITLKRRPECFIILYIVYMVSYVLFSNFNRFKTIFVRFLSSFLTINIFFFIYVFQLSQIQTYLKTIFQKIN